MSFSNFHPITLIVYFVSVTVFTMITKNPVMLLLSFSGALFSVAKITKRWNIGIYLALFLAVSVSNPIFSHNGETVLFYLFEQRVTLEAFFYGMASGVMIVAVLCWFALFGTAFTEDKLTWLIGKISPKLCVVFCMALRFVPLFKDNAKNIYNAQISMGIFDTNTIKGKFELLKNVFSALISISIENAIETADTMRARSFENKKHSSYSLFKISSYDIRFTLITLICDILVISFLNTDIGKFYYYPKVRFVHFGTISFVLYGVFFLLCFMPVINEILEDIKWKYLISRI